MTDDIDDPIVTYYSLTVRAPQGNALSWLNELAATYGDAAVSAALRSEFGQDGDIRTLLGRVGARLQLGARQARREREAKAEKREQSDLAAMRAAMSDEDLEANRRRLRQLMVDAGIIDGGKAA